MELNQLLKYHTTICKGYVIDKTITVLKEGGKVLYELSPEEEVWHWTGPEFLFIPPGSNSHKL